MPPPSTQRLSRHSKTHKCPYKTWNTNTATMSVVPADVTTDADAMFEGLYMVTSPHFVGWKLGRWRGVA